MKLQKKAVDIVKAIKIVKNVVSIMKSLRRNSATEFRKQFVEATTIGKQLHGNDFELSMPRLSGRQIYHSNPLIFHTRRLLQDYSV